MKFKLTEETIVSNGITLHRIECTEAFKSVKVGEKGGFVEKEENLSQLGNAWVHGNAWVCGNARVYDNAMVCDNARVYGNARVYDNAMACDNALVSGNALVCDYALVSGNAEVYGDAEVCIKEDYIVFKNSWSSGRYFTWTRSNDMWKVGCFYGTGEELIKKAYSDSENSGKHYEAYVRFVEQLKAIQKQ